MSERATNGTVPRATPHDGSTSSEPTSSMHMTSMILMASRQRDRTSRPAFRTGASLRLALAATAVLATGTEALAQSRQVPAPPQSRPIVLEGGTVHPVSRAEIPGGHVVIVDGAITAVGAGPAPEIDGAEVFDVRGRHVYPGLIEADTDLGLVEVGDVSVTHDHTEQGVNTAEVRAAVAVNPDSDLIPVARANGILTALTRPGGGDIAGRAALIRLDGWTWEDLAIDADAGLVVNWPRTELGGRRGRFGRRGGGGNRGGPEEAIGRIDRAFDDAEAYLAAHDAGSVPRNLRFEGMRAAIDRSAPVLVRAGSAGQIETAVAWAQRRELDLVIVGGGEADRVAHLLQRHDVPVLITGVHRMPSARHAAYDEPFTLPARLHAAGVRFAIASGGGAAHMRNLNHNAATAAAYGLAPHEALRAVTLSAAEILGVADRLGSIDVGKAGTLIVTTGDPLEITSDTILAFIDGRQIDLGSRQKTLYEKYRRKYEQSGDL